MSSRSITKNWHESTPRHLLHCAPVSRSKVKVTSSHRLYVSSLSLLNSGNKCCTCVIRGRRGHTLTAEPGGHTFCYYYGRTLSVSGRPCYILPMFLFFLWPPYSPALVNGGSRKFYTWWTLSVIRDVTTWIFSWSSLSYRVGQKVTKFCIFWDPARKLSALTPERGRIL